LDISGVAICAFGPLSNFTRHVDHNFSIEFTDANTLIEEFDIASIEECKATCLGITACESFSATTNADGNFDCSFYQGSYPRDEDLVNDQTSTVYTRNDLSAVSA